MCRISDKLKLCTCITDFGSLKHYWVFHRFSKDKNDMVIGLVLFPTFIDPEVEKYNEKILERLLNEKNPFDIDIAPCEKDRLVISIRIGPDKFERIHYGFEFKRNKWKKIGYDPFEWMWHHDKMKSGKIKNALKRKRKGLNKNLNAK